MKLYKEDQRYHDITAIALVAVISALLIATVFTHAQAIWKVALGIVSVVAIIFLTAKLRMKIRIGRKKMSIRVAPIPWSRIKLSKDEVTGVEFVHGDNPEITNALSVHYGAKLRIFNFGDKKGMIVHRADGRDILVLSSQLYDNQGDVLEQLKSNGWQLS